MMKKSRRIFLKTDEVIRFTEKKRSYVERYFDKSRFSLKENFFLYIDHGIPPHPTNVILRLHYLNLNGISDVVQKDLLLTGRGPGQTGHIQERIPVSATIEDKELFKVSFEHIPTTDSRIYVSVSDL
jgi:hypothetical protein